MKLVRGISVTYDCEVGNCPHCGKFIRKLESPEKCSHCNEEITWDLLQAESEPLYIKCPRCKGTGDMPTWEYVECHPYPAVAPCDLCEDGYVPADGNSLELEIGRAVLWQSRLDDSTAGKWSKVKRMNKAWVGFWLDKYRRLKAGVFYE